ncbi:MAG: DnaJ domain-containing protein [Verrucomicrobia bacterium]|nr:DnaJ domain-containing protein [Verrucomicrobiota bacterium]
MVDFNVSVNQSPLTGRPVFTVQPLKARIVNIPTSNLDSVAMAILSPLRALASLFKPSSSPFSQSSLIQRDLKTVLFTQFVCDAIFQFQVSNFLNEFSSFYQIPAYNFVGRECRSQNAQSASVPESRSQATPRSRPRSQSSPTPESRSQSAPAPESRSQSTPRSRPRSQSSPTPESRSQSAPAPESRSQSAPRSRPRSQSSPTPESRSQSAPAPESRSQSTPRSRPRSQSAPPEPQARSTQGPSKPTQQEPDPAIELRNRALGLLGVKDSNPSNYSLLGLPEGADKAAIKKAYVKLSLKFHPDKYTGDDKPAAEEAFKLFSVAYHQLYD